MLSETELRYRAGEGIKLPVGKEDTIQFTGTAVIYESV